MNPRDMSNDELQDLYFENLKFRDTCDGFDQIEAEMVRRGLLGRA
jgi:hypothetical protein